jgi:hypothetical protein
MNFDPDDYEDNSMYFIFGAIGVGAMICVGLAWAFAWVFG